MIRIKKFLTEEILSLISYDAPRIIVGDYSIKTSSNRLICFATKGSKCIECGLEGSFFAAEKSHLSDANPHLNLYAIRKGIEVLMTADHIVPVSKGGKEYISNLQTMCTVCNLRKGNAVKNNPILRKGIWSLDIDQIYEIVCGKGGARKSP